jgi:primosomal protein N' (replication factor Y)
VPGFASVVLTHPSLSHLDRAFTYRIPVGLSVDVGARVRVPFRRAKRDGVVVEILDEPDVEKVLPIHSALGPGIGPEMVELCRWVGEHYLATLGEALAAAVPERVVEEEAEPARGVGRVRARSLQWLQRYRGGAALRRALDRDGFAGFSWRPAAGRAQEIASLVAHAVARGRGALVLLPEVRFAGDTVAALAGLGETVAWLGSDRPARERYRDWLALRSGAKRIAVGGRAAVYAPVPDLGLVVVDDEAHVSYKERRAPRINARPVAHRRAQRARAVFVAVGTPPSVEAMHAVERGALTQVAPPRADLLKSRPPVTVVDRSRDGARLVPHAETLRLCKAALDSGRRAVLLTHRGGDEARRAASRAFRILAPRTPARLDARTPLETLAAAVSDADCIVATPVIAKDLAIEGVGVVAILEPDAALSVPEFRGTEEAFATWWHVARWAFGGSVVVETAEPRHPAIRALIRWDPEVLYRFEASRRRETGYPPFAGMARIDAPPARAQEAAHAAAEAVPDATILGPLERGGRSVVVVRTKTRAGLLAGLGPLVARWRTAGEPFRVDVDPREVLP